MTRAPCPPPLPPLMIDYCPTRLGLRADLARQMRERCGVLRVSLRAPLPPTRRAW